VSDSDTELIARVLEDDDRTAFGELVKRHQSAVRGFLRQLTRGQSVSADDLAQDTFIQAYRSLDRFHGTSAFTTWLLGIAYNHFRNARRKQREVAFETVPEPTPSGTDSPTQSSDLQHDVSRALHALSPDERAAVLLHYERGLSHREVADVLAWPIGTVKTHLARSKEKLRPLLSAWNPTT